MVGVLLTNILLIVEEPVTLVEEIDEPFLSGSLDLTVLISVNGLGIIISNYGRYFSLFKIRFIFWSNILILHTPDTLARIFTISLGILVSFRPVINTETEYWSMLSLSDEYISTI
jgi:hypothetical protein